MLQSLLLSSLRVQDKSDVWLRGLLIQVVCPGVRLQLPSADPIEEKSWLVPSKRCRVRWGLKLCSLLTGESKTHLKEPASNGGLSGTNNRMFGGDWNQITQKVIHSTQGLSTYPQGEIPKHSVYLLTDHPKTYELKMITICCCSESYRSTQQSCWSGLGWADLGWAHWSICIIFFLYASFDRATRGWPVCDVLDGSGSDDWDLSPLVSFHSKSQPGCTWRSQGFKRTKRSR